VIERENRQANQPNQSHIQRLTDQLAGGGKLFARKTSDRSGTNALLTINNTGKLCLNIATFIKQRNFVKLHQTCQKCVCSERFAVIEEREVRHHDCEITGIIAVLTMVVIQTHAMRRGTDQLATSSVQWLFNSTDPAPETQHIMPACTRNHVGMTMRQSFEVLEELSLRHKVNR
jgi:hypothetical protein